MGARTMLTGTFLAEQTHSNPPSYTLVSVSSAIDTLGDGPRARPVQATAGGGGGGGASGAASAVRRARAEKMGAKFTKLPALEDFEPLLDQSEDSVFIVPARRGQKSTVKAPPVHSSGGSASAAKSPLSPRSTSCSPDRRPNGAAPDRPAAPPEKHGAGDSNDPGATSTTASPADAAARSSASGARGSTPGNPSKNQASTEWGSSNKVSTAHRPASSQGRAAASRTLRKRPASQRSSKRPARDASPGDVPSDPSEVFDRMYCPQRPWMFGKTDMELLTYLAKRSGDPDIAVVSSPCESPIHSMSFGASPSSTSSFRATPRKHRHHRELFVECLHKDSQRSSPDVQESQRSSPAFKDWSGGKRPLYSPQRLAKAQVAREKSSKLDNQLQDITILPVRSLEAEEAPGIGIPSCSKAAFDQAVQYAEGQLLKAYKDYKAWCAKHGYPAPEASLKAEELDKDKRSARASKVQPD